MSLKKSYQPGIFLSHSSTRSATDATCSNSICPYASHYGTAGRKGNLYPDCLGFANEAPEDRALGNLRSHSWLLRLCGECIWSRWPPGADTSSPGISGRTALAHRLPAWLCRASRGLVCPFGSETGARPGGTAGTSVRVSYADPPLWLI